jgi:putative glutamine amidotransferase
MSRLPLIGIPADRRLCGKHYFHMVGEKYIEAVAVGANALPVLVPALGPDLDLPSLLDVCDGLLLTGSASNVEPHHYGGPASEPGTLHDPNRDATTLPLIPQAIAAGLPVLAICRGFQEMNVAYGGTLHQRLHEVEGLADHREDESTPLEVQYGPAHEVLLEPGASSRRSGWPTRRPLRSACNGIRNGSLRGINFPARCLPHLARPADSVHEMQGDLWRARFSNS